MFTDKCQKINDFRSCRHVKMHNLAFTIMPGVYLHGS